MATTLGILSLLMSLLGYYYYIRDMVRGDTKPHGGTWLIRGLMTGISFAAQVTGGGGAGSWALGLTSIACVGIGITGLFLYRSSITSSDIVYLIIALGCVVLWQVTATPLWSVIIISLADAAAFVPTMRKSWHYPYQETMKHYLLSVAKLLLALFALEHISLITALYPASLVVTNSVFCVLLWWRRKHSDQ